MAAVIADDPSARAGASTPTAPAPDPGGRSRCTNPVLPIRARTKATHSDGAPKRGETRVEGTRGMRRVAAE